MAVAALALVGLATLVGAGSATTRAAPTNTTEPRINGRAVVGSTLTATTGTFTGSPNSYGFQWTRCPALGGEADASDCAAIGGATTNSYVPGTADVGKRLRVRVTATNGDGPVTDASNATAVVTAVGALPRNTVN